MTEIETFLTNASEPKLAQFHHKLIPSKYPILGVKIPVLRKFAKQIKPEHIKLENPSHEEILLYGFCASNFKTETEQLKHLQNILPYIDNWCTCDCIIGSLKKLNGEVSYQYFSQLLNSEKEFYVRVGVIGLMRNFLKTPKIDDVLKNLNKVSHEGYYVKMAIAWTYAELGCIDFEKLTEQLKITEDKFIRNKSISKARESFRLSKEQKQELLLLKV